MPIPNPGAGKIPEVVAYLIQTPKEWMFTMANYHLWLTDI